ncbi:MAG TPA: M14 family metallopeptidase [Gemmatimonadota bacterium]|nr:M14 family metallopeptidase [Gemmatimonadota bacterium]
MPADARVPVDWNRYYDSRETGEILRRYARAFPELTELSSIGESYEGRELLVIEVTNEATGPAAEKPALSLDGGLHARELTGSAVALYVLGYLLESHGRDPRITRLLDGSAFYIRPKFNPDGADLALHEDQRLRSTVRPVDEDHDGRADEDPPEDLDGDGRITWIRVREPGGREARLIREGIDNDGDGRINEDGVGGIDMNRNFPRFWEPEYLQPGAGDFPLSEPETYATVRFINAHPNIVGIVHGHTSGGFVYRLPSASDPTKLDPADLALIEHLGDEYTRTTGRPVRPSSTHPTEHRYGTLIEWGYQDQGVVGWVPEYSPADAWITDYDQDGEIDEAERHRFNDEVLGGRYFTPWHPYDHPTLGRVEIGGWWDLFWGQNPPAEYLEAETRAQVHWILWLLERAPRLTAEPPTITPLGDDRYRVTVTVRNSGFLPTNLTERGAVGRREDDGSLRDQIVAPPFAELRVSGGEVLEGEGRRRLPHLAGSSTLSRAARDREATVEWVVRKIGADARVEITAAAEKAGVVRLRGELP